jgi:hypothetical protein
MLSLGNPFVPGISAPASVSSLYAVAFKRRWKRCSASFEHRESIDIIGEVKCWVRDLEEAWEKENDRQRNEVTRDKAASVVEFDIAAPRPTVWEHFTLPGLRPKWRGADEVRETLESGRRGVGTTNYCMHGLHAIIVRTHGRGSSIFVVNSIFHIPPIFNHPSGAPLKLNFLQSRRQFRVGGAAFIFTKNAHRRGSDDVGRFGQTELSSKADSMIDINRFIDIGFRRYAIMFIGGDAGASLPETTTTGMPRRTGSFTRRLRKPRPSSTGIDISRTMSKGRAAIVFRRSMAFCPF